MLTHVISDWSYAISRASRGGSRNLSWGGGGGGAGWVRGDHQSHGRWVRDLDIDIVGVLF